MALPEIGDRPDSSKPFGFNRYLQLMNEMLRIESDSELDENSSLYDDWGLDSLQAFELIILTEQLAGLHMAPSQIPELFTTLDAYDYYLFCRNTRQRQTSVHE